jgi:Domain of unknown function (DUF6285)
MAVPTHHQLIEAVKQFIDSDVTPKMEGRTAFHARIASNVLAIVMRELAQGIAPDNAKLCADIRSGAMDENTTGLLDTLLAQSMAQVAIDNPKYSTYLRLTT